MQHQGTQHAKRMSRPIWKVVIGTTLITLFASLIWHESRMLSLNRAERKTIIALEHEERELHGYRDAIVRGGLSEGARYLLSSTTKLHEF